MAGKHPVPDVDQPSFGPETFPSDAEIEALAVHHEVEDKDGIRGWAPTIILSAFALAAFGGYFVVETREQVGGCAIALMLALMLMRLPVAFALGLPGLIGLYILNGWTAIESVVSTTPYDTSASWTLSVLPMFVLMGMYLWLSGVTTDIYVAARNWLGWLPGGLSVGTNAGGAVLSAITGSTIATTYPLARAGVPEMLRAGYEKKITLASISTAGLSGQLIPPSTFLVLVAGMLETPVGPQLMAGVVPGILVAVLFGAMFVVIGVVRPHLVGRGVEGAEQISATWRDRWVSVLRNWPTAVLIIAIFGGLFAGILTATESGALGAFGALIICLVLQRKHRPWKKVLDATVMSISTIGAMWLLLIAAQILQQLFAVSGIGRLFAETVIDLGIGRFGFLILVMLMYFVLGMFMESISMLLLTLPFLIPVLSALDIDLIWFGVFCVFMCEIAMLLPPIGVLTYILHGIVQDPDVNLGERITLLDVFKSVWLMLPMVFVTGVILILFPQLATWLPSIMKQ